MLINFTNHPSSLWSGKQREAAAAYGSILDLPFPEVDPQWTTREVVALAEAYLERIAAMEPAAVVCQGEMGLSFCVAEGLMRRGVLVLAACSRRICRQEGATKTVVFEFEQFRAYGRSRA